MGKRKGLGQEEMHPHNLTMTALGTGLLWFGWFGFNAGSALAANKSAVAGVRQHQHRRRGRDGELVAHRVAPQGQGDRPRGLHRRRRRPGGDHARPPATSRRWRARRSARSSACVCYGAILLKGKLGYDDSLDVFGVHGVGGCFGAIAVGIFATATMTEICRESPATSAAWSMATSALLGDAGDVARWRRPCTASW